MARAVTSRRKLINTVLAWAIGLLIFFPILWTILTSFKTEAQAIADPPIFFFFDWTTENYAIVQERSNYMRFLWNSVFIAVGSTILGLIIAVPAAWSMAFVPSKRTKDILLWMLSTKMLPAVGVLYPIYLLFIKMGLLDSRIGLVIVLMLINLPIIVWMLYTYFKESPDAHGDTGHRLDHVAERHPRVERGVLDAQPDGGECRPADGVHRQLFQPRRLVLRQAERRFDDGHRADPDPRLVQPETTRARPDLWRGEINETRSHGTGSCAKSAHFPVHHPSI